MEIEQLTHLNPTKLSKRGIIKSSTISQARKEKTSSGSVAVNGKFNIQKKTKALHP